jgi:hypothetical protein
VVRTDQQPEEVNKMEKKKCRLLLFCLEKPKFRGIEAQVNWGFIGESLMNDTFPLHGRVSINITCGLIVPTLPTETLTQRKAINKYPLHRKVSNSETQDCYRLL